MRVKSRWFRSQAPKPPGQVASAVAFIVWRLARNALTRMRAARFDIDPGVQYFAFLGEFLVFLIAIADRIAYAQLAESVRVEFTTALGNRVGEILEDNETDLLGVPTGAGCKRRFIALVNESAAEYASFRYGEDGPDFGFLRHLGNRISEIMQQKDQSWTLSQIVESEAPDAVAMLQKAMRDLFAVGPRAETRPHAGLAGE